MCILHVYCTMVSRVRVSAMHRDRYAVRLGPLAIIRRQRCHRTLRDHAKAERNSRNCRVGARRPNLPAHRQQGHPIDGNRPGRGQPWIMDARCHAMHAGHQAGCFSFLHRLHSLPKPRSNSSGANQHDTCARSTVFSSITLRAACSGIAPWLSEL